MLWSESNNLSEIQVIIEDIFEKKMRQYVRVCDIIDLSFDEYLVLINHLKSVPNIELAVRFGLCLLVAWVTSYKFNRQEQFYNLIMEFAGKMPQHHTKFVLDALNNICYDYQIYNYKIGLNDMGSIQKFIRIHAGYDEFI